MKESTKTVKILISLGCTFIGVCSWSYIYTLYLHGINLHPFFYFGSGLMGMWLLVYGLILLDVEKRKTLNTK